MQWKKKYYSCTLYLKRINRDMITMMTRILVRLALKKQGA